MKVIDNILLEWSYRCPDGIVDMNDPKKVKILFEILKPILKEDIDDELLDALSNTDEDTKTKVLKLLKRTNKNLVGDLKNILNKKGIGALAKNVLYDIEEAGQEDELLTYINSPDKQITLNQLQNNTNLYSLFKETGLDEKAIKALVDIGGNIGNVSIGRGETALITLLKNAKKGGKGDIIVDDKKIEIKNRSKEGGEGSLLVPEKETRGGASEINNMLVKVIDDLFTDDAFKEVLKDNILKTQKGVRWTNRIDTIYKAFLNQKQKGNTKSSFEKEINQILKNLYKENAPKIEDYLEEQNFNIEQFKLDIAKKLAEDYYKESKFDYILFINPDLSYTLYKEDTFLQDIGKNIVVSGFSDYLPRLYYKTPVASVDEGLKFNKDKDKIIITLYNNPNDLLLLGLKDATIGGVNVYYSMEYNQQIEDAKDIKKLSDDIKDLNNAINKEELYNVLKRDLQSLFTTNYKPKTVYYLESSAPLSKMIGEIIKDIAPDTQVLPLYKIKYPSWKDMLIPDYETQIKSENFLIRVERAAQKMWEENDGKVKSSGYDTETRKYFKPKYDIDKIIEDKKMMFIDDNVQTGTDFKTISNKFNDNSTLLFYAAIRLNRVSSTSTTASRNAKTAKIPFEFKPDDLKKFSNNVGVKSTYSDIGKLISKGYVTKNAIKLGGNTYYLFANTNITLDDLIKK